LNTRSEESVDFNIGGISISVSSPDGVRMEAKGPYREFLAPCGSGISMSLRRGPAPGLPAGSTVRYPDSVWQISETGSKKVFSSFNSGSDRQPSSTAVMDPDLSRGEILIHDDHGAEAVNPISHPLDEILIISALSRGLGMVAHACGAVIDGDGILFIGSSGKGKSTIASILMGEPGAVILNDDRIIIRRDGEGHSIYGTPWHGTVDICSNRRAPLKKIYFIKHSKENSISGLSLVDRVMRLMSYSFPAFWDRSGTEFALDFCRCLADTVPCRELGFVPDRSFIEMIKGDR
jgi:hypothetical protein